MCVHAYCIQGELFIHIVLMANAFLHLNTRPPIIFIANNGRWRVKQHAGQGERLRGVCMYMNTHQVKVMRIGANWWCNLFHPPSLCSPLPLAAVQHASSHCLLHCNLPSFTVKHQNQLTSFLPLHLFTSAELKYGQARFSARAAER